MATVNPPPGALAVDSRNGSDPFVSSSHDPHRQRYAAFDNSQFSLYLNGSPAQAKRALQAHLSETTRRLQETSHLGNALVQQRRELEEKLQEVEQQQQESDIGPELRQRLAELEKEFNEVGRETARAFLPKSRAASGETDVGGGASVYSSEAQHSPTKVSVPSRKQRNQQPSRINDVALATEISTSLLSQLKDLQAVLLERDDLLKAADLDRSQLEIEVEGLSQRLRTLDESESRLKDVNWNLETQVREFEVLSKSAADKEHRLNHALNLVRSEKSGIEREFEDLRQQHSKLSDDHINKTKQTETELTGLRRNVAMTEMEKNALLRKVEDLSNQNQELAKAVAYRMRADEQVTGEDTSPDDGGEERDTQTPEHSPPPSPSKATPRHGMLESETLKHSLQHAHRMIQQLKNNIHREKTEKIELKRMLQDARDELETNRGPVNGPGSAGKRKKFDKDVFKKPARPDRLGALRSDTHEILEDDEEWEEQDGMHNTPSRRPRQPELVPGAFSSGFSSAAETSANEGFETANETSDAAFETANERDGTTTETDAFLTGAETLDGDSSDELTETEAGPSQVTTRTSRSSLTKAMRQDSYESTASTSGDDFDELDVRTPMHTQQSRFRLKGKQSGSRKSTPQRGLDFFADTPPNAKDSPASFASNSRGNTPAQGKSLFAELNDLSGDEDDASIDEGTPSRSSVLFSPESSPEASRGAVLGRSPLQTKVVKAVMVDSGMMTEPEPTQTVRLSSIMSQNTQPQAPRPITLQMSSLFAQDTSPQAQPKPSHLLSSVSVQQTEPKAVTLPTLQLSSVSEHSTLPQVAPIIPLSFSALSAHESEPKAAATLPLSFSSLSAHESVPKAATVAPLALSSVSAHESAPRAAPVQVFDVSSISAQHTSPTAVPSVAMGMSSLSMHHTEPQHIATPALGMSSFTYHETHPIVPTVERSVASPLGISTISHESTHPKEGLAMKALAPAALLASAIHAQSTEPREVSRSTPIQHDVIDTEQDARPLVSHKRDSMDRPRHAPLQMSDLSFHSTEPRIASRPQLSTFSTMSTQATEPFHAKKAVSQLSQVSSHATAPVLPKSQLLLASPLSAWSFEPMAPLQPLLQLSTMSSHSTEPVEVQKPRPSQLSSVVHQSSEPVQPKIPALSLSSTMSAQASEPIQPARPARSTFSVLSAQGTQPLIPQQQVLHHAQIATQHTEPLPPQQQLLQHANIATQHTEPLAPQRQMLQHANITTQHTEPREVPVTMSSDHRYSNVTTLHDAQPESPTLPAFLPAPSRPSSVRPTLAPALGLSTVLSQDTEPISRPTTAHRTVPVPISTSFPSTQKAVGPVQTGFFDSVLPESRDRHTQLQSEPTNTRDARVPLAAISSNNASKSPRPTMSDGGTQTMVSADQIDKLLLARSKRYSGTNATVGVERSLSPPPSPSRRHSNEVRVPRRPGSSSSMRSRAASPPPLPSDHKEVIAAAAKILPPVTPGAMGPPMMPASAYKKRPQTPTHRTGSAIITPKAGGTTPRAYRTSQRGDARSGASSPISRRSSLSSFSSEVDQRFNIQGGPTFTPNGLAPGATDPRMIQAITQTMIGEYLWKYTRKTGREGLSENRHRRFFWIHPYTRTLYWSDRDPQSAGKTEMKGKSVAIESVQEVEDGNPLPPGLHQKSLLVTTPGRSIKFTAPTGQRHETWFNALNYLCQRVDEGEQPEQKPVVADEINDEFNAGYRSSSRATGRSRASMASYATRRTSSPHHAQVPTLRPSAASRAPSTEPGQGSVSSRFSNILRPTSAMRGSFSSRRSRTSVQESTTYEEPSKTDLDLSRDIHDHVERDLDNMVNVRACCEGKFAINPNQLLANMIRQTRCWPPSHAFFERAA
jgi:hypothetical protein